MKLTIPEVAKKLGVSTTAVYNWIEDKKLPYTKGYYGTRPIKLIDEGVLDRWLKENRK